MTAELRQALRFAIDRAVRARIPTPKHACAGCGVELFDPWTDEPVYVSGCRTCSERRAGRAKRERQHSAQLAFITDPKEVSS